MYEDVVCNYDLQWAITNGWSVSPRCKLARVDGLDLSGVKIVGGDFNQSQLQAAVEKEANLHRIAMITEQEREGQTVVFCTSVASARGVCHYLQNNYGVPAVYVYGTMPDDERAESLSAFKSGRVQVLVNCQVVAVGFDHPPTKTLILGRPTRSRSFWLQCVGRATRPLPGVVDFEGSTVEGRHKAIGASEKQYFKIVDCTPATLDHNVITAVDMFCDASEEVKKVVRKAAAEAPLSQSEMDELAQKELERIAIAKEIERRRAATIGRARGSIVGHEIEITAGMRRDVGTYRNPLRGKFAGLTLNELPDYYLSWALTQKSVTGWIRSLFIKERDRRNERRKESQQRRFAAVQ
jgi:superfamily II DNA or RNA helicase